MIQEKSRMFEMTASVNVLQLSMANLFHISA